MKQTLTLDSSQIVQFLKCPTYHNFVSVRNLTSLHISRAAMDRGTVMHGLIQRYYHSLTSQESPSDAANFALSQLNDLKKTVELTDDDYKIIVLRFQDYWVKYFQEKIQVAVIDGKPALEVGFSVPILDTPDYYFILEGKIDMISVMSDQLVIWDHKCQSREYYLYGNSIQMLNYALAVGAKQTMHNYIRLHAKVQPNTYVRKLNYISKQLMERWERKLLSIFKRAANPYMPELMKDDFPNDRCSDIGFGKKCPFTEVCQEPLVFIQKAIIKRDFMERPKWEPWSLEEVSNEID